MSKMTQTIAACGAVVALGVAAFPLSTFAADPATADIEINTSVNDSLSLSATGSVTIPTLRTGGPIMVTSDPAVITVGTNKTEGYTLKLAAKNGNTNLTRVGGSETIPTGASTTEGSAWGYNKDGSDAFEAIAANTSVAASTIANKTGAVENDETRIYFGAKASASQRAGDYRGTVTVTATVNG